MSYAIIKSGGKQYRVEEGQTLLVERLPDEQGAKLALPALFYSAGDGGEIALGEDLGKVKVEAKVLEHLRGPKIRVFKFKPKRGYKRTAGHRQELTRIEVTSIKLGARKAAAKKQPEKQEAAADGA